MEADRAGGCRPFNVDARCNNAQMKNSVRLVLHSIAQRHMYSVSAFHRTGIASSPLRAMPTLTPRNDARREGVYIASAPGGRGFTIPATHRHCEPRAGYARLRRSNPLATTCER